VTPQPVLPRLDDRGRLDGTNGNDRDTSEKCSS